MQARLWHLPSSHYSEKVRWALDLKRVPHTRRVPLAVPHVAVAYALSSGQAATFPVLQLGRRSIADSTAILAALEQAFPDPPLYPGDPAERRRALALEDWFDERLGTHIRVLALGAVAADPPALRQLSSLHRPAHMEPFPDAWAALFARSIRLRYRTDEPGRADAARAAVGRAFDRLEEELGGREHLVGDRFTVADLTAASHLYWLVQPPEGPRIVDRLPPRLASFMARFADRDGYRWVLDTYRRHRRATAPVEPVAAAA